MSPEKELLELLQKNTELIEIQHSLYKKLENIKDPITRTCIVFEEMVDKLEELKIELNTLLKIMR
jgi:hypothetical protein